MILGLLACLVGSAPLQAASYPDRPIIKAAGASAE
jgi:hypothetical protein